MQEAVIKLPETATLSDIERFCRLAVVFYGHHAEDGSWIFTEMRGRKCLALWEAGFDAKRQYSKKDRRCIVKGNETFRVSDATRVARAMGAVAVVEEVA